MFLDGNVGVVEAAMGKEIVGSLEVQPLSLLEGTTYGKSQ